MRVIFLIGAAFVALLSALLVTLAVTDQGRMIGLAFLAMTLGVFAALSPKQSRLAPALLSVGLALVIVNLPKVNLNPNSNSGVSSVYLDGSEPYRFSPSSFVPEVDQLTLGVPLATLVDPLISLNRARRIRSLFRSVYAELDSDPNFAQLPSALGKCYQEILGLGAKGGQLFVYKPQQLTQRSMPVLMFVHGSLGNFKAYTWILKKLADKRGISVVAPSFGSGNWYKKGGLTTLGLALDYIKRDKSFDASRVTLIALSNGGIGAGLVSKEIPERVSSMILLSAVVWPHFFSPDVFKPQWHSKPLLFVHGAVDERLPLAYSKQIADQLKANGLNVSTAWFANEDHFLFFSKPREVLETIDKWGCENRLWDCN